ncbi:MAG: DUF512 domain-containing protein, partial [Acidimicrobiia bacterium]|nr:DUF512 domain-containing protein [Acidimicrobiia bacterium]
GSDPASPERTGEWRTLPAAPAEGYRATPGGTRDVPENQGPVVVVTGRYGRDVLEPVLDRLAVLAGREMRLLAVENKFFGGNVGVAGLLVGEDLVAALAADDGPAGQYLIPDVALSGHQFLDEMDFADVAGAAKAPLKAVATSASGLIAGAAA